MPRNILVNDLKKLYFTWIPKYRNEKIDIKISAHDAFWNNLYRVR